MEPNYYQISWNLPNQENYLSLTDVKVNGFYSIYEYIDTPPFRIISSNFL